VLQQLYSDGRYFPPAVGALVVGGARAPLSGEGARTCVGVRPWNVSAEHAHRFAAPHAHKRASPSRNERFA
jgi:hypothetical protein